MLEYSAKIKTTAGQLVYIKGSEAKDLIVLLFWNIRPRTLEHNTQWFLKNQQQYIQKAM
jgi:hypothetical protein